MTRLRGPWASLVAQGRMGEAEEAVRRHNNVVRSHRFRWWRSG